MGGSPRVRGDPLNSLCMFMCVHVAFQCVHVTFQSVHLTFLRVHLTFPVRSCGISAPRRCSRPSAKATAAVKTMKTEARCAGLKSGGKAVKAMKIVLFTLLRAY